MNKKLLSALTAALVAAGCTAALAAHADDRGRGDIESDTPVTLAVFGDWPYNQLLLDSAPLLVDSINADYAVSRVIHVGDIHSGSMPCTSADILPPIATSNPGWNQKIHFQFQQFAMPVVYTPGDNEWTDCHKSKEKSSGDPLKELASVRSLFFAQPGMTLGHDADEVSTQARDFDPAHPEDAQFVENVMWEQSKVVFVTLNMPGSNNDSLPWSGAFANPTAQTQERDTRTAANMRWLQAAFDHARTAHARAVVIAQQADMWDPEAVSGDGLGGYTPYVQKLADLATTFGRPVLLLNGDSHKFEADRPLADPTSDTGKIHHTQAVPNLQRLTVQGSTNAPAEWLRLTVDPRTPQMFSWSNVAYCKDPQTTCQF